MSNPFEFLWKDDPLKMADELIRESDFVPKKHEKIFPINISLLILASVFLALSRALYGEAGFSLAQHLLTSLVVVFIGYLVVGVALFAWQPYPWVNNKLRCFLTCFIAALTASLFLVYFSEPITDAGIAIVELFTTSDWLADRLPDAAPPAVFSALGYLAIYGVKHRGPKNTGTWRERGVFVIYWFITSAVFYFVAFDRGWFFATVMRQIVKIKLF